MTSTLPVRAATKTPSRHANISVSANPWDGASAVYVAVDVLNGMDVPNSMTHPFGVVTADDVQQFANVPDEDIACPTYDREWVRANLY